MRPRTSPTRYRRRNRCWFNAVNSIASMTRNTTTIPKATRRHMPAHLAAGGNSKSTPAAAAAERVSRSRRLRMPCWNAFAAVAGMSSSSSFTRSRRSLPGLKCGTYLPASATVSPVLGLRPWRGGRKCRLKLPKPRISMRCPCARASLMISRICLTASSTSFAGKCPCFAAMSSISSDFVMLRSPSTRTPPDGFTVVLLSQARGG